MAKKKKRKSVWFKVGMAVLALMLLIGGFAVYSIYSNGMTPNIYINNENARFIYVMPSDGVSEIAKKLAETGNMRDTSSFVAVAEVRKMAEAIKPGKYELTNQMSNVQLVHNIMNGRQATQKLVFNNIRTKEQLCGKLASMLMADSLDILRAVNNKEETLDKYRLTSETVVSMFIPNTYDVYWTISPQDLMERMHREYEKFWTEERQAKADTLGLSREEVSTMASIVEEETKNTKEQPVVAGLYYNRIKIGMLLQADPTIKFAVGDFNIRRIGGKMLDVESPYNTYKYLGLPPGPIRIPSIQAIDAVLNMERHKYIYMCASDKFDGTHNFAASFEEHQKNAAKYHRALNRRKIK